MLKVNNLVKTYGKFMAVKGLSFELEKGMIFGFVGPNGAGKTTTMKIMAGLLGATDGNILLDGSDLIRDRKLLKEKIGYMPDFFGVYDNLKVSEYMDFYAGTYYIPYKNRKSLIDNLLEIVDLNDKKDSYVDSLSRGMKQRLCLARSLIHDPEVLLLDEPASGLDPRARVELKEILKNLGVMGKTIIISSHILPELAEMCTEVGIIDKGIMQAQGTVHQIMRMISKKRKIGIKPVDNMQGLISILKEMPNVESIIENKDNVEIDFEGDDTELSQVLSCIVSAGIPIISFKEKEGNLEEIFMEITGGGQNDAQSNNKA